MIDFNKNNLDKSTSPYLKQHQDNPINWQEWGGKTLEYAKANKKKIFVSIGYSTCHWCHVMAVEAFSDRYIADVLNKDFVCIKVDKEQRPDIDLYFMKFLVDTTGHGGWPLNVFLNYNGDPIFALTYAPVEAKFGIPAFMEIVDSIKEMDSEGEEKFVKESNPKINLEINEVLEVLKNYYDQDFGGFGIGQKFPPYNTILFLLSYYIENKDEKVKEIIEKTLDVMAKSGLHDHLQGGFFRYCVNRQWQIPHFEKMLYDQAMLLWTYSVAYKVLNKERYKGICMGIVKCLDETFENEGLYFSAHDADTNHKEGTTYLWSEEELSKILTVEEYKKFSDVYVIDSYGNFEGKNHLIKKVDNNIIEIERKLLEIRRGRDQPFLDKKIITSWNALLGVALIQYYRCTGDASALGKGKILVGRLISKHFKDEKLYHSSLNDEVQTEEFLEDYSAMLLLLTYIYEEDPDGFEYDEVYSVIADKVKKYREDDWTESDNSDFKKIKARFEDSPTPSSISMAEFALFRKSVFEGGGYPTKNFQPPLNFDFYNMVVLNVNGDVHIVHSPTLINWSQLPANTIQVKSNNNKIQDCYKTTCKEYNSVEELLKNL